MTAEKPGFKRALSADVILNVDEKARVDLTLRVGDVKEVVAVVAISPLVRVESSELGEVVGERAVRELPLNGRNVLQLQALLPGVVANGTSGQFGQTNPVFIINGARSLMVNYTLDGAHESLGIE